MTRTENLPAEKIHTVCVEKTLMGLNGTAEADRLRNAS